MSRAATRATAALLCGVVLVALGLAFVALPGSRSAPESLRVDLDFDSFVPGETQTRTSTVQVPTPSRVTAATVTQSGPAIVVDLTVCQLATCRPLVEGLELDPGPHTLRVDAVLAATGADDIEPGAVTSFGGQIQIVEIHDPTEIDATLLLTVAGVGLLAIAVGVALVHPRQRIAS